MKIEPKKGMIISDTNDNLRELECDCTCGCEKPFLVLVNYTFESSELLKQMLVCKNCGNIITVTMRIKP